MWAPLTYFTPCEGVPLSTLCGGLSYAARGLNGKYDGMSALLPKGGVMAALLA